MLGSPTIAALCAIAFILGFVLIKIDKLGGGGKEE